MEARQIQAKRSKELDGIHCNAQMPARAYDRILKVARTAADLAGSAEIRIEDLAEAIHFRSLDREGWEIHHRAKYQNYQKRAELCLK